MSRIFFLLLCIAPYTICGQNWSWEYKASMPEPVSNNATASAMVNGMSYVYSFGGIDSTRIYSGIHLKSWRYDVLNNQWDSIASLPDTLGKIAAGASTIGNKIYILGGYHVFANGFEASSDRVHIYDPETNQYEADGAAIPVPIDDHVQAVWRDSLIFVITGWSDVNNVDNVQIYNPSLNQWSAGTPVPNSGLYKVFGGSGVIIEDTIYYIGGAKFGNNFPLGSEIRKGVIDPNMPTSISWTHETVSLAKGYRMGAFSYNDAPHWIGGSIVSYNYNGIAYNGSGAVAPQGPMLTYDMGAQQLIELSDTIAPVMDIRGVAQIASDQFMIVGGMLTGPSTTKQTILLTNTDTTTSISPYILENWGKVWVWENQLKLLPNQFHVYQWGLFGLNGQAILSPREGKGEAQLDVGNLANGVYVVRIWSGGRVLGQKVVVE